MSPITKGEWGDMQMVLGVRQGGRTWQPFVGSKNGNENVRQARIYNFRVKCVVFGHNRKFAKLIHDKIAYVRA